MNIRSFYTVTIIIFFLILSSTVTVSAYYLTLEAPAEVRVGEPIVVTGTTNVPPPDKIDIIFSHSINIPVEVTRQSKEITEKGDTTFNITFDTNGLERGNYKIEAISQTQRDFSAGSKNLRVIKLTDRSDIIRFSSPKYQDFEGNLVIEARIQGYEDNAIQMEVKKGNTSVFGPESVPVNRGLVKYDLPIKEQGQYLVLFNDYKGYIGSYPIQVGEEVANVTETPATEPANENSIQKTTISPANGTTREPTVTITRTPTGTPVTEVPVELPGTSQPTNTVSAPEEKQPLSGVTTTASVSRDSPGYFLVTVKQTPVTITTSDNEDWVVEYKKSAGGAGVKVNDQMKAAAEKISVSDNTKQIYLKVYPYSYKTGSEVTLTADNAEAVSLSDDAAKAFGAPPRYGNQAVNTSGKSPAPLAALIAALFGAVLIVKRRQ